jgi:hypothetical protein
MAEWASVLAVFWVLWALDGVRLGARRVFTIVAGARRGRSRINYNRVSWPGLWPASWRIVVADVPLSFSPAGVCNRIAGAAGRPAETPTRVLAWRWEEIREVGVARGWIYVNGARFCADTGHLRASELLSWARLAPAAREPAMRTRLNQWFRPVHLRRRARVLVGRTVMPVVLNTLALVTFSILTGYVLGEVASRLPTEMSTAIGRALPWALPGLFALHVAAVVLTWRALRRVKPVRPEKRASTLFSALLLPPQALRLRAVAGEGFFPAQHPLACVAAFGDARARERAAFDVLADLRWPIGDLDDGPLGRDVLAWFSAELEQRVLATSGFAVETLLAPPQPDAATSYAYCPRCRAQFIAGSTHCPQGVALRALRGSAGNRCDERVPAAR